MHEANANHYNNITNPWQFILGDNFHWGLFNNENESLEYATDNLIDEMASYASFNQSTKLLDIGCGIGTPSIYLHKKFGCKISGLSNSEEGVNKANKRVQDLNLGSKVSFYIRDALDNKFSDDSFDICWLMEMSHLIDDKKSLINETYRSLRTGGKTLLCDLITINELESSEIYAMKDDLRLLERSFGHASLRTLEFYSDLFTEAGYVDVKTIDISKNVIPTLSYWKENLRNNENLIRESFSNLEYDEFLKSCDILENLYTNNRWGYGIIIGSKP
jgi:27-O-demethylrifamycin SV methyltransferase